MLVIIKYLFIISYLNLLVVFGLKVPKMPRSPCPDKFVYKFDKNMWFADLKIGPFNYYTGKADIFTHFSINAYAPEITDVGSLTLMETKESAFQKLESGISLDYRVYFPFTNMDTLPYLTRITLNENTICAGPEPPSPPRTRYFLEATLSWPVRPNTVQNEQYNNRRPTIFPSPNPLLITDDRNSNPIPVIPKEENISTECGIIGNQNNHPWLVGLFEEKQFKFVCPGTLISTKFVITAAYCTSGTQNRIFIKLGTADVTSYVNPKDPNALTRFSDKIYPHMDYDSEYRYADISLLLLNEEITISNNVRPICLWPKEDLSTSIIGKSLQLVGWTLNQNGSPNRNPFNVNVIIDPVEKCANFDPKFDSYNKICASDESYTFSSCDPGGALVFSLKGRQTLRGLVPGFSSIASLNNCNTEYYTLFTDIAKYYDWINFMLRLA